MKKILICFACVAAIVSCGANGGDGNKVIKMFSEEAKAINEAAPIPTIMGTIDGASMNGKEIVLEMTLDNVFSKFADSGALFDKKMAAISMVSNLKDSDISGNDIKTSGIRFKCLYMNADGKLLKEVTIDTEDIVAAYERLNAKGDSAPLNDRQFYIDYVISSTAPALPVDTGNGVVCDSIYENASGVEMKYVLTDPAFEYVDMTTDIMEESVRSALLAELQAAYKYTQFLYEDMAKCGIVYTYTYVSKGGRELFKVTIPMSEVVEDVEDDFGLSLVEME